MLTYVLRRVGASLLVLFAVMLLTYVIFFLLPSGDPAVRFVERAPSPESVEVVRDQYGLDKPWYTQFGIFVKSFVTGDEFGWPGLGESFATKTSVRDEIIDRAPRTLSLAIGAAVIWLIVGVTIGCVSALRRGGFLDRLGMGFALLGVSVPVFWLGLMLLLVFWQTLGWLPGTGYVPFAESPKDWFLHLVLPWLTLAFAYAAFYARMVRGNLLETMEEDYIRSARAKGLTERRVILKHGLRAGLTPIVTMFGLDVAILIGGVVITETVFNIQGIGAWAVTSTLEQDLPAVIGVVLVLAVAVAVINLLVDLAYMWLDPRVRYQ